MVDSRRGSGREATGFCRRSFMKVMAASVIVGLTPKRVLAGTYHLMQRGKERALALYNPHTGESLKAVYWAEGGYVPDVLNEVNYLLRDYRAGEIKPISLQLLDTLYGMNHHLESDGPFHIISGYRTPKTNALLRKRSRAVAKKSLHMEGKAVDIRLPGCELKALRRAAMEMQMGGVGYYPKSCFVHVDVGDVRYW
jgi:uncharacterized protein YcbK (DUF882 family)